MTRPRLLDLFCGAGGAAVGYHRAGFDVVGVDIAPQPHYPFTFRLADALAVMRAPLGGLLREGDFDAIHASPPCQAYSVAVLDKSRHPRLLEPTRELLSATGLPWVIENVPGAPMRADYELCGSQFLLPGLRRHRWFETSWRGFSMMAPCFHDGPAVTVIGHGPNEHSAYRHEGGQAWEKRKRAAMGIDWPMSRTALSQAIPPAYTEYIGRQLLEVLA